MNAPGRYGPVVIQVRLPPSRLALNIASSACRISCWSSSPCSGEVQHNVELISHLAGHLPKKKRRAFALDALATLVGAMSMARAVNDATLSQEILTTAAAALKARLA